MTVVVRKLSRTPVELRIMSLCSRLSRPLMSEVTPVLKSVYVRYCNRSSRTSHMPSLSLTAPDVLEETIALGQSVHRIVALAHCADEAAEGVDVVLAGDGAAVLVDLGHGDLDGAVVLGLNDPVGGAALAGDVAEAVSRCSVDLDS